eukprot:TRINITY_DN56632_c0_g1_i1.p1 TRINITY_DN56632_c0_g1~~TRINITY_DN56632_c0_g1_i1.p1  ORF type:complete len:355 (-),score=51.42 TRINITY_DN56632_c0_g1_i1:45-1040(-)
MVSEDCAHSQPVADLAKDIVALAREVLLLKRRMHELTGTREGERDRIFMLEQRVTQLEGCQAARKPTTDEQTGLCREAHGHLAENSKNVASNLAAVAAARVVRCLQGSLSVGSSYKHGSITISSTRGTQIGRKCVSQISQETRVAEGGPAIKRKTLSKTSSKEQSIVVAATNDEAKRAKLLFHTESSTERVDAGHGSAVLTKRRGRGRLLNKLAGGGRGRGALISLSTKRTVAERSPGSAQAVAKTAHGNNVAEKRDCEVDRGIRRKSGVRGVSWHRHKLSWIGCCSKNGTISRACFRRARYRKPGVTEEEADAQALRDAIAWRRAQVGNQ